MHVDAQRLLRIERLLDPLTRSARDKLFGIADHSQVDFAALKRPAFVHYTSAEAAMSILRDKMLWMRNASCMDDWSEVQHGHQILCRYFANLERREAFLAACDEVASGIGLKALQTYDSLWATVRFGTHILSVSEHDDSENLHGRLSMWRAFGGAFTRVAFVFRPPALTLASGLLRIDMRPVTYKPEAIIHDALDSVANNIANEAAFFRELGPEGFCNALITNMIGLAVGAKHSAFAEEREWRVVHHPNLNPSTYIIKKVQVIGGLPQLVYHLPIGSDPHPDLQAVTLASMFERLIIGPTPYTFTAYEAFVHCLNEAGIENASEKVVSSGIPLR